MNDAQTSNNRAGIITICIVAVFICTILGGAGYYLYQLRQDNVGVKDTAFAKIEDETVRKHLAAQANQLQQRFKTTAPQQTYATTIEIDATNSKVLASRMITTADNKPPLEVIILEKTYYIKDSSDNKWWMQTFSEELDDETTGSQAFDAQKYIRSLTTLSPTRSYQKLREETCGALRCYVYAIKENDTTVATIQFDTDALLLRTTQSTTDNKTTTTVYSYDNIAIKAPEATKPVPPNKSIFNYYTAPGSQNSGPSQPLNTEQQRQLEEIRQKLQIETNADLSKDAEE